MIRALGLGLCLVLSCSSDSSDSRVVSDAVEDTMVGERPEYFPASGEAADEWVEIPNLSAPVRVVYDERGIPHMYAESVADLLLAQGYVTARDRLFQMHTLRVATSGRLAELLGPSALSGDALLRILKLRHTAERMAERTKNEFPDAYAHLEQFALGVNAWLERVNAREVTAPIEVELFQLTLEPWTPADTLSIVRLQTWNLGFDQVINEDELLAIVRELQERFDGTPLEGVEADVVDATPPTKTATVDGAAGKPGSSLKFDLRAALGSPFYRQLPVQTARQIRKAYADLSRSPHVRTGGAGYGSNNWVVSGEHTASGRPMLANDPHLSLRNPAVFYQSHGVTADGEYNVSGVNFAGAPGVSLGTNGHISWGATVFYSDVTDMYWETFTESGDAVLFQDKEVSLERREEVFGYTIPGDGKCESGVVGWLTLLAPQVAHLADNTCQVTLQVEEVPHHGPLVPWTLGTNEEGRRVGMSWRWTGFEPTDEFVALDAVVHARSYEDFKEALDHFGVGAQNWVYADRAGNIGWYPSHQLPIREHIAAGDWTHPPFLPMPGEGGAEWDGFVPREELPQSYNPTRGYLVTANADPTGVSFDGDPFNDGHYLGYMWTPGFRMERASERVAELVSRGEITPEEMAAVQADDRSNVGVRLRAYFVEALKAAESGATPEVAGLSTPQLVSVRELLEGWDLRAMSGVGAEPASSAANSAAATLIFNVSLTYLIERLLDDEGLATLPDRVLIRLLLRIFEEPSALVSWDPEQEQSRFCDDQDTPDVVEKCTTLLVLSTLDAVAWLASEEGGGRTEIADWRWGDFHTVRLRHPVVPLYDIPPTAEHVRGYPRPGDNFGVDASPPGLKDRDFSTGHGPAVRHVLEMLDTVTRMGSIAGGQREDPRGEYYRDQMDQWVENEAPMVPYALEDVLEQRTRVLDLMPPIPSP